ncbi:ferredoxin--NADP reductase [Nocardioides sp. Kera G14]|uniref:ferredoxin--NADP reductase n=1 Tax=Nocardioides sp. Kera G14 TaxID=2884264 RepID=UPI001D10E98B|nr:ferredoxin--NADP reductase [Nocardioides sp. Kera G14]UDY22205.1 ferredoxin--NADP reductase [Nocardioides sp. Kera G14]
MAGSQEESFHLKVLDVIEETDDARTVVLDPGEHTELFRYRAGQFITVAIPSERTGLVARCYSLSSSPHLEGPLAITVKRTLDGYASQWICSELKPGDSLQVLVPSGIFTPADLDQDLLLFAGGSGVTPIISIVRNALAEGSGRIVVFYANRDERSVIFAREWAELAAENPERLLVIHWLESVQGLPTQEQLKAFASAYTTYDAFVCGPAPFMKATTNALKELGFPRERRHQEKFVSLGGNPFGEIRETAPPDPASDPSTSGAAPAHLEYELDGESGTYDDWEASTTLLSFLESKGVKAPYSCREGECSACAFRLLKGDVKMLKNDVLDDEDIADGIRLGCQSLPTTDSVKITYS